MWPFLSLLVASAFEDDLDHDRLDLDHLRGLLLPGHPPAGCPWSLLETSLSGSTFHSRVISLTQVPQQCRCSEITSSIQAADQEEEGEGSAEHGGEDAGPGAHLHRRPLRLLHHTCSRPQRPLLRQA